MIFLLLSIVSFTLMMLVFKFMEKIGADTFQVIVFNYITAAVFGFSFMGSGSTVAHITHASWFQNALLTGISLILIFYLIALTTQKKGISVSIIATKMSVVVPVVFAFFLYGDKVTFIKISGITLALAGVYMSTTKNGWSLKSGERKKERIPDQSGTDKYLLLPVVIFIGSGLIDTYLNYTEKFYLSGTSGSEDFIPTVFAVAAIASSVGYVSKLIVKPSAFALKNILMGAILGIFNFFSLYFLIKSLHLDYMESSVVFTINNIGIVSLSTVASFVLFKEQLSRTNKTGIVISLVAVLLITFS